MTSCKPLVTPMSVNEKLSKNDQHSKVDEKIYRSLVGSFNYLTNTRPDLVHTVSVVSRFMTELTNNKSTFCTSKKNTTICKRIEEYWTVVSIRR